MDFNALAIECAPTVAPQTLAAIVKTESNFNPLAININKGYRLERQPRNKSEAITTANWLINHQYNIDMGLGQVNSANLRKTGLTVHDAFDPCKNLAASASILKWNYESASRKIPGEQQALHAAISAYNTGSFTHGFSNGYVQKVVGSANQNKQQVRQSSIHNKNSPIKLIKTDTKKLRHKNLATLDMSASQVKPSSVNQIKNSPSNNHVIKTSDVYGESVASNVMVYQ